jgi:hypothetical protein
MDFLKKHYEKIILSVVLLAVVYFALRLPQEISAARQELISDIERLKEGATNRISELDLTGRIQMVQQLYAPTTNQFSGPHNVFNPVQWKLGRDGNYVKVPSPDDVVNQLKIVAIRPLKLVVGIEEGTSGTGDATRIKVSVMDQSLMPKSRQGKQIRNPRLGGATPDANDLFKVISFKGEPSKISELVLELRKGSKQITLATGKPYEEIVGYEADALFELDGKTFKEMREGSSIRFDNEIYKVIAITSSNVTIEAQSTPKRYTRPLSEPVQPQ